MKISSISTLHSPLCNLQSEGKGADDTGKTVKSKPWKPAKCPKDCFYRGREYGPGYAGCNYLAATGELRGCDPGKGCIRYVKKGRGQRKTRPAATDMTLGKPDKRKPGCTWDHWKGYALWQEGQTARQIAERLGISRSAVQDRKKRYWEKGQP